MFIDLGDAAQKSWSSHDNPMFQAAHMNKRVVTIVIAAAALLLAGLAFDRHRAQERDGVAAEKASAQQANSKVPPLPQHEALLAAVDEAEISGRAMCGFCYWREGGSSCNTVLEMAEEPGIVFLLPNEKREEMEKLTGTCAVGKISHHRARNDYAVRRAQLHAREKLRSGADG